MPVSHQFNRRIAAIGAALALVALPVSSTFTPAFAQPSPSPSAEAGSTSTADAEAADGADGSDTSDGAGSSGGADGGDSEGPSPKATDSNPDADSESADETDDNGDGNANDGDDQLDDACKDPADGANTEPCTVREPVKANWSSSNKTLKLKTADTADKNKAGNMPRNWAGEKFKLKKRTPVSLPVQDSSSTDSENSSQSADNAVDTDDSGHPLPSAAADAAVPETLQLADDGSVVPEGGGDPVVFTGFTRDPDWTLDLKEGKITIVSGRGYPDSGDGSDSNDTDGSKNGSAGSASDKDGENDSNRAASTDASPDGDSSSSASSDDDGSDSARSDASGSSGDEDDAFSNSNSASDNNSSSNSNSESRDRANSSTDKNSDDKNSTADSGSRSDGSRNSDSDSAGSGSDSSPKDDDGNDSDDPDGSPVGTADGDNTTPDPSNGNGSKDDERETIPGTAGDEWLPGDEDHAERPDYSDPVPQNPDAPTPKDDTDLITGGDKPSPRANQQPSTSFGESIVSTIVSSWPVFVLAASGMAAVGFIIYIMGRRGKQE
ncbi:hypothetical protein [Brevibacterium oceani]|uniref:hypothetical protein n=1 Tax=Brevibacterium oceani TaxID=358099 RepID=UPI0015E77230|nr:hypothetical protein [Brevibacterium oceani]